MANANSIDRARYDFKKAMEELRGFRGRGTELISVYVPYGKLISDVMAYLRDEQGQASNIKSKTTMKNVTSAIDSIMARLKTFDKIPENGVVIFCGEVPRAGDQTKMVQYTIQPPEPITAFLYRCDAAFFTDPLDVMLVDKRFYGLIVIDRKEATIGMLAGTTIKVLKHYDSLVPSKHHQGGQSSVRFERLIEIAAHEFFKKVADGCTTCFLDSILDLEGILVGGPGMTKDFFINNDYLHHELLKKVVKPFFDTGYTDESGLKELVDAGQGAITDMQITQEKEMVQRLFREIRKSDGGLSAYGEDMVRRCADMGAVDTFLISSMLRKYRCQCQCNNGHSFAVTVDDPENDVVCPECNAKAKVLESKDLVDDFFEMSETYNSNMQLISGDSEEGEMLLRAFGGIAALLRYRIE
ncbi:peptide chain release factor subunit 1 (aeRF-1) [Thermoplasmatales archaeon BRNA1]|nr:peptide chain release factor subunit 1 (aeRF-1) [Thermoplasmatales archaeon BRNA1]